MALESTPNCSPVTIVRYWTRIVPIFTHCRWGYWRMRSIGKGGISAALLTGSAWLLAGCGMVDGSRDRSEEHTSELQSLMRISYAVFCLKKKKINTHTHDCRQSNKVPYKTCKEHYI